MKLEINPSPHIFSGSSTRRIMLDVIIALIPALAAATVIFGPRALLITATTTASCVLSEYFSRRIMKRSNTISDLSAVVTGILLAFNLPVSIPLWIAALGGVVAVVVVKQMFGGLGQNFVNPALFARIVLLVSFPNFMSPAKWASPFSWLSQTDAITCATPLNILKNGGGSPATIADLFTGTTGGSLGETCAAALLIGAAWLMFRKVITPVIPFTYMGTVALMSLATGHGIAYQLFAGGLMLGAFFMATDYVTSPVTIKGQFIFALGCGIVTSVIRFYGFMPEGVSYAIVLMNILVPHIDRITRPKPFGGV